MKVGVLGAGYVGLVAGTCLADAGHHVVLADVDEKKIAALHAGELPIYEPGLAELLERSVRHGRLRFTADPAAGAAGRDVVIIAVGTPPAADGTADLSHVFAAAKTIAGALTEPAVVAIKSTVPVGTNARVREIIAGATSIDVEVVSNPEFLKEGAAIEDFLRPDRVVIGTRSERAARVMDELYAPFVRSGAPIQHVSPASAELGKYAANGMLAARISFMNEIAALCGALDADVDEVRDIVGSDARIGRAFLFPGLGYGGSCFPKDVGALCALADELGVPVPVLAGAQATNRRQKTALLPAIESHFGGDLAGKRFAVWGLAFKPRTDDVREAPSLALIGALLARGATVCAHDPEAAGTARRVLGESIDYAPAPLDALDGADALVVATEWNEFRSPDFGEVARRLNEKVIFDGRNLYRLDEMERLGFHYYSIGRRTVRPAR